MKAQHITSLRVAQAYRRAKEQQADEDTTVATTLEPANSTYKAEPPASACGLPLFLRHYLVGALKDLAQHVPAHLDRLLNSVKMQDRRRDVVDRSLESHQSQVVLDPGPYGEERTRDVIAVREIVLSNYRSRLLVVHVCMRVGIFELAQRFDAVIGDDNHVRALANVLQIPPHPFPQRHVLSRQTP